MTRHKSTSYTISVQGFVQGERPFLPTQTATRYWVFTVMTVPLSLQYPCQPNVARVFAHALRALLKRCGQEHCSEHGATNEMSVRGSFYSLKNLPIFSDNIHQQARMESCTISHFSCTI